LPQFVTLYLCTEKLGIIENKSEKKWGQIYAYPAYIALLG